MKKAYILIPILIIGLFIAHYSQNRKIIEINMQSRPVYSNVDSNNENTAENNTDIMVEDLTKNELIADDIELLKYKVTNPSAAIYKVQKRFLSKEAEEVLGETTSIAGIADFNLAKNELNLFAEIDLLDLRSNDIKRDEEVLKMFSPQTVKVTYSGKIDREIFLGEDNVGEIDLTININGVEKKVPFNVTYIVEEHAAHVKGQAKILMSEFNITPPSILNVYTVDDEVELFFDINFKKN